MKFLSPINGFAGVVVFAILFFSLGLPSIGEAPSIARASFEEILDANLSVELSRMAFAVDAGTQAAQSWSGGDLPAFLMRMARNDPSVTALGVWQNDELKVSYKRNGLGLSIDHNRPVFADSAIQWSFETVGDSLYLQAAAQTQDTQGNSYSLLYALTSPLLNTHDAAGSGIERYMFLKPESSAVPIAVPFFKEGVRPNLVRAADLANQAWEACQEASSPFVLFRSNQGNYAAWVVNIPIGASSGSLGIIMPRESIALPLRKVGAWGSLLSALLLTSGICAGSFFALRSRRAIKNVQDLIGAGESEKLEFKSSLRWDFQEGKINNKVLEASVLKSIAAFANGQGGRLLIGVNDDGRILGLEYDYACIKKGNRDGFENHLRTLIKNAYGDSFCMQKIRVRFFEAEGKDICCIQVKKGIRPVYTAIAGKSGAEERFYVRNGNSSRAIEKPSEIALYIQERFKA